MGRAWSSVQVQLVDEAATVRSVEHGAEMATAVMAMMPASSSDLHCNRTAIMRPLVLLLQATEVGIDTPMCPLVLLPCDPW